MSSIIGRPIIVGGAGGGKKASANLTPQSGVTYIDGLSGLEPAVLSLMSAAISNNRDITSETMTVYVDYGDIHCKIDVGNQVTIALNSVNYAFDVIGFNHDTLTTSAAYGAATKTGKAGITFQMHGIFATDYPMNSSNTTIGGWKSSEMRTSTMPLMKGHLPTAWQTAIKPVNKASGLGGGSTSGTEITSDDCFLLAEIEIFGSTTQSVSGEGTQYAYYKAGNSTVKNKEGYSDNSWWERSPGSGEMTWFCYVATTGDGGDTNSSYTLGVAFGFCV